MSPKLVWWGVENKGDFECILHHTRLVTRRPEGNGGERGVMSCPVAGRVKGQQCGSVCYCCQYYCYYYYYYYYWASEATAKCIISMQRRSPYHYSEHFKKCEASDTNKEEKNK
jgi:hypothetical protein